MDIFSLEPGMKLGRTVYSSMGEILLKVNTILTPRYIKNLMELGVPYVYVDNGLLKDYLIEDIITIETRTAAVQQIKNILLETKESGKLVIKPSSLYNTVRDFTDSLFSKNHSLMFNLTDLRTQDDYTFAHSVNVCVLSLMTGMTLGYTSDQLAVLGVGALLHDLGKVKIPDHILNKPSKLTDAEFAIMQKHPYYGHELITSSKELEREQAIIALQHHESLDGSGYPSGLSGHKFHEYAQIVAIADKFDALTANRIYRKAYPSHEAFEMCAASGNYLFKDHIVKGFLYNIAAYPSGTLVQLNNKEIAVVLETPRGYSRFPKIRILFDHKHRPILPTEVSLSEHVGLFISKVLDGNEIAHILNNT
ncbi:HD-GYP domain-containing protein [Desulforamulus reducens]|uniref:HD-GYP domain-containing protein n=1 Tax=Desulforamulus reducens TaxID=59610 RepID=UPI001EE3EB42|nr:HD-GYP domain-containing protein [Desulforamulus reducens]